ncbi:hypothetical protein ACTA71_000697 [Dictyostelium dimigraforme]
MDPLLKSGLEAMLKIKIEDNQTGNLISYKEYASIIHGVNHNQINNTNNEDKSIKSNMFIGENNLTIYIRHLSGKMYEIKTHSKQSIMEIKLLFFKNYENTIKPNEMVLNYNGKKLENNKLIEEYNIRNSSTLSLYFENSTYSIINTFDAQFNYDFTHQNDRGCSFKRGGYNYQRPCGSFRYALQVLGRFDEPNEIWLGQGNGYGEWAVSYHNSINDDNCLTTPSFDVAKKHAFTFNFNKINYYLIFQNRINTATFTKQIINNEEYWKSPNSSSDHIRPYSICIGRV